MLEMSLAVLDIIDIIGRIVIYLYIFIYFILLEITQVKRISVHFSNLVY